MKTAYKIFTENKKELDELTSLNPEDIDKLYGKMSKLESEQLMALVALVKSDIWMITPLVFEDEVLIINGVSPDPLVLENSNSDQIWYALFVMNKIRPDMELGPLVKGYIEFVHSNDGFFIYPKESELKSKLEKFLPEILNDMETKTSFDATNIVDNQASKLYEALEYMKLKIVEDGTNA